MQQIFIKFFCLFTIIILGHLENCKTKCNLPFSFKMIIDDRVDSVLQHTAPMCIVSLLYSARRLWTQCSVNVSLGRILPDTAYRTMGGVVFSLGSQLRVSDFTEVSHYRGRNVQYERSVRVGVEQPSHFHFRASK